MTEANEQYRIKMSPATREPPRGNISTCAVRRTGGITKAFNTIQELVDHIYAEYGNTCPD